MSCENKICFSEMCAWQAEDVIAMLSAMINGRVNPDNISTRLGCDDVVTISVGESTVFLEDECDQLWGFASDDNKDFLVPIYEYGEDQYGTIEDVMDTLSELASHLLDNDMHFEDHITEADMDMYQRRMSLISRHKDIDEDDFTENAIDICVLTWNEGLLHEKVRGKIRELALATIEDYDNIGAHGDSLLTFYCKILECEEEAMPFVVSAHQQEFIEIERDDEMFMDYNIEQEENDEVAQWRRDVRYELFGR